MNQQLRIPHPESVLAYHTKDSASPPYLQVYVLGRLGTNDWSLAPPSDETAVGSGRLPAGARARQDHAGPHRPRDDHPWLHPERWQERAELPSPALRPPVGGRAR